MIRKQPQSRDGDGNPASVADDMLRSFFDRWQRLEEEKKNISDDLKDMFAEAKGLGFDTKAMRAVFREQTGDKIAAEEFDAICDLYRSSLAGARPARARENVEEFPRPSATSSRQTNTAGEVAPTASPATNPSEPNPTPVDRTDEPEADATTPLASGNNSEVKPDRASPGDAGGHRSEQSFPDAGAKNDGLQTVIDQAGQVPGACSRDGEQAATISEDSIPLFLLKDHKPLRPNCLNPSNCAGYGSKTCHSCLKAAGQEEGRAA